MEAKFATETFQANDDGIYRYEPEGVSADS